MATDLGTLVKLARVGQALTQTELARRAGVSQAMITKIETGRVKNPGATTRIALADALGHPRALFLAREEIEEEQRKADLVTVLMSVGVSERAARLIVDSIRERSRSKVFSTLEAEANRERIDV